MALKNLRHLKVSSANEHDIFPTIRLTITEQFLSDIIDPSDLVSCFLTEICFQYDKI